MQRHPAHASGVPHISVAAIEKMPSTRGKGSNFPSTPAPGILSTWQPSVDRQGLAKRRVMLSSARWQGRSERDATVHAWE